MSDALTKSVYLSFMRAVNGHRVAGGATRAPAKGTGSPNFATEWPNFAAARRPNLARHRRAQPRRR